MAIKFYEENGQFHLYNEEISYIFKILKNGQLGHLYYGKRLTDIPDYGHLVEESRRDMAACPTEEDNFFSLESARQEYPTYSNGDVRYGAYEILWENGSSITEFVYKSHRIYDGKESLSGLPATYVEDSKEAETLEIVLQDKKEDVRILLSYTIFRDYPVITKNVRFINDSSKKITLLSAMTSCVDFPDKEFVMVDLAGAWSRERNIREHKLDYGVQSVHSMRGCSSHQFNPFLALKREHTDEFQGEIYGFSFVYSGNFLAQVEVDDYDVTRVLLGIHPNGFQWELGRGEEFQTPEAVLAYSDQGMNRMSQVYHELYRTRLARGVWRDKVRPILINNWEATYFDFNEEKILAIAEVAKRIGVELFVLDDGWFGKRDDSTSSLGDWYPHLGKLPNGVKGLADKIRKLGLEFGIWIEPESVNRDSDLYRNHPDWVMGDIQRNISQSRNQLLLDFSKKEVVDYIYHMFETLFDEVPISYVKWDMNRNMAEVFSNGNDATYQGKVRHKYILGVYDLYDRLTSKYPNILFESCASGGARFDPGILYYAPQGWTSDNTDAIDRLKIQYGTSIVYPISCIGSHVSAAPNHQTFRNTSLQTRANVAYFGTFGYELDVTQMTEEELEEMKEQVLFMKKYRELIQKGVFYRLKSPFEGNETAWMVVSKDEKEALVGFYRVLQPSNAPLSRVKLKGLEEDVKYSVNGKTEHFGDELMQIGIITSDYAAGVWKEGREGQGDYMSKLYHLKAVE